jgi:hypothetical protein
MDKNWNELKNRIIGYRDTLDPSIGGNTGKLVISGMLSAYENVLGLMTELESADKI